MHPVGMMRRTFTLAQANALIPYLTDQFTETRRLAKELRALRLDVQERDHTRALQTGERTRTASSLSEETLRRIETLEAQIRSRVEETASLGIEVRRIDGLVDFPAWVEGQVAFLCWRFGEERICFWHPTTQGFDGRRALASDETDRPELN
jgi:hypothetical protein